jgi:GTPase Era involved in 16S rRNA processing
MKFISKIVLCATLMLSAITGSQAQSTAHPLAEVFSAYFSMKDALVKDDASATSTKAKELFAAIAAVKMEAMQGNQHMTWMKFQQKLSADAEHIKGLTKIEEQRKFFIFLSKNMREVLKVFKTEVPVYYQHCPMANNGKGADWLSLEEKISNPYMGKKMLTCGKTTETIK